jgi:hypothetical protein
LKGKYKMEKETLKREILNAANTETQDHNGVTKCRIDLDNSIFERYNEVKKELKNRDAAFFGISQYLSELLAKVPRELDSGIVEKYTPLEYKIKSLLQKDGAREKLEKLISKL